MKEKGKEKKKKKGCLSLHPARDVAQALKKDTILPLQNLMVNFLDTG